MGTHGGYPPTTGLAALTAVAPTCGDRKVLRDYNDLRTTHPKIAREWNKVRNGDLKPTDMIANSNKRVWWKCKGGHEWSGLIVNRARKGKADPGCPYCSGRKRPERPIRLD